MWEKDEVRRRRELDALKAKEAKLRDELANLRMQARSAKSRLKSTTRHEDWHSRRLAHLDRLAGYTGEMASARIYVRSLGFDEYVTAVRPYALANPTASNLEIEIIAVRANEENWNAKGEAIVLERERQAADAERADWEAWQAKHPDASNWRAKPMSRRQYFLVSRTVDHLDIEMPEKMNRGEAFDWLESHGGNLRLVRKIDANVEVGSVSDDGDAVGGDAENETGPATMAADRDEVTIPRAPHEGLTDPQSSKVAMQEDVNEFGDQLNRDLATYRDRPSAGSDNGVENGDDKPKHRPSLGPVQS